MNRNITCIVCPRGCSMEVSCSGEEITGIIGNSCKRGREYACEEILNPTRTLTSTVKTIGGRLPVVPVKTDMPVKKELIFECMKEILKARVTSPVKAGDVIIRNIAGSGADLIATADN
jgi:CxxC motif-containing protein